MIKNEIIIIINIFFFLSCLLALIVNCFYYNSNVLLLLILILFMYMQKISELIVSCHGYIKEDTPKEILICRNKLVSY